ncbi:unnamed protein product [Arabidopsis thaliana]|uniref:(thale cress) hypothetical protein n=1 Tax=Arabidopsis thaliana TaxID=3702 RepID=A0A7G2ERP1_ARATH|nr:unnamed protein product [Arabidopsis thaliana]
MVDPSPVSLATDLSSCGVSLFGYGCGFGEASIAAVFS